MSVAQQYQQVAQNQQTAAPPGVPTFKLVLVGDGGTGKVRIASSCWDGTGENICSLR